MGGVEGISIRYVLTRVKESLVLQMAFDRQQRCPVRRCWVSRNTDLDLSINQIGHRASSGRITGYSEVMHSHEGSATRNVGPPITVVTRP